MRIIPATLISLFVVTILFFMVKIWGSSQLYIEYKHPFFANVTETLNFKVLTPATLAEGLKTQKNIYLNIATTADKKLIVISLNQSTQKFQTRNYPDLKDVVLLENFKDQLKDKKIIFNLQDNPLQATPVFIDAMKNLGLESGDNFIYVSPYDPPAKDLKQEKPTYLFGATDPEILKIKAMESLYVLEAATFRADVIIHPLTFYKQPFFTETLINELNRRYKRFIIGPLQEGETEAAMTLKPLGIIVN